MTPRTLSLLQVPDVILPYEGTSFKVVSQTNSATRLRHAGTKNDVELLYKPFRINFYSDGELVISGNRHVAWIDLRLAWRLVSAGPSLMHGGLSSCMCQST
jgi:hypothetical protein